MIQAHNLIFDVAMQVWHFVRRLILLAITAFVSIVVGFTLYAVLSFPDLKPWHTERLDGEFSALRDGGLDFDGYLKLEARLFDEMHARIATWDHSDEAYIYSRFNPDSNVSRLVEGAPFNRSFRLTTPEPVGHALLIHGLSDSPYSMKALAEALHARGFEVTVLRLPGHGTLPSAMTQMSAADWTAAVRIAARDVASRTPAGQPFYIGGYSTGGTLALQYTLDALADTSLRKPDRILLVSPAIEVPEVAVVANVLDMLSIVPLPALQKVRWQEIGVEYDPYKFNSFTINATRQVNRSTRTLQESLATAVESGRIERMPPVVTWQSVVDATVGADGVADVLYARLHGEAHRLVLFDVNRQGAVGSVQRPGAGALIERLSKETRAYTLDLVVNTSEHERKVSARQLAPDGVVSVRDTELEWPETLVSLSHVALPFPPDDPVYGLNPGSGRDGIPSIGSWLFRGESGAVTISLGSLTRPRSNPFWQLIDEDVAALVEADRPREKPTE
ncbi:MAG TPA: alpha/beta fold hydrolase [Rudaea sp.]|jgi:alpha-beta hydrolase superfamily lysophospholipase|nr:alpha/beta fold hydrolase [Rudaea sp.]